MIRRRLLIDKIHKNMEFIPVIVKQKQHIVFLWHDPKVFGKKKPQVKSHGKKLQKKVIGKKSQPKKRKQIDIYIIYLNMSLKVGILYTEHSVT